MKLTCIIVLFFLSVVSTAHSQYTQKVYSFIENPIGSKPEHFIYIEMAGDSIPIWDSAMIDNNLYVVHASIVDITPLQIGERKIDKRLVVIKPEAGNRIWRLDFDLVDDKQSKTETSGTRSTVLLKGSLKNRRITYRVIRETELVSLKSL